MGKVIFQFYFVRLSAPVLCQALNFQSGRCHVPPCTARYDTLWPARLPSRPFLEGPQQARCLNHYSKNLVLGGRWSCIFLSNGSHMYFVWALCPVWSSSQDSLVSGGLSLLNMSWPVDCGKNLSLKKTVTLLLYQSHNTFILSCKTLYSSAFQESVFQKLSLNYSCVKNE